MTQPPADDRLIAAIDVPNAMQGVALAEKLGDSVSFYKIGLGMLTGGGLALANELKDEMNKRIFLDMKLFDIGATVEAAVERKNVRLGKSEDLGGGSIIKKKQLSKKHMQTRTNQTTV